MTEWWTIYHLGTFSSFMDTRVSESLSATCLLACCLPTLPACLPTRCTSCWSAREEGDDDTYLQRVVTSEDIVASLRDYAVVSWPCSSLRKLEPKAALCGRVLDRKVLEGSRCQLLQRRQ